MIRHASALLIFLILTVDSVFSYAEDAMDVHQYYVTLESLVPAISVEERCIRLAGERFRLDYFLLKAIRHQESGQKGQLVKNLSKKGDVLSIDIGEMQINSVHIKELESLGIDPSNLMDTCVNIHIGAWYLRAMIDKANGNQFVAAGWYNSQDERYASVYRQKVAAIYNKLRSDFYNKSPSLQKSFTHSTVNRG